MDYTAPTNDEIAELARKTADHFPAPFNEHARAVAICVDDWPEDDEEDDPYTLTGLYVGVPLTQKGFAESVDDTVWLFRRPIIDEWAERGDVTFAELVAHVTTHEFAHHFGWTDDQIATIDRWWE